MGVGKPRRPRLKYKVGDCYNDWEIIGHAPNGANGSTRVTAKCMCGRTTKTLSLSYIIRGVSKRCYICNLATDTGKIKYCKCGCGEKLLITVASRGKKYVNPKHRRSHYKVIRKKIYLEKKNAGVKSPCSNGVFSVKAKNNGKYSALKARSDGVCGIEKRCRWYDRCGIMFFECDCLGLEVDE